MDITSYVKIHRKKPVEEKLDLLISAIMISERNRAKANEALRNGAYDNADYYTKEFKAFEGRARWLLWCIRNEIAEIKFKEVELASKAGYKKGYEKGYTEAFILTLTGL